MNGARELWHVCGGIKVMHLQVHVGYEVSESPTPKYANMHMKLAWLIAVIFLVNYDSQATCHIHFVAEKQYDWH